MESKNTDNQRILKLPIHPAVKKFILANYGAEPLRCSQQNVLGKQLRAIVVHDSKAKQEIAPVDFDTIELQLSTDLWKKREKFNYFAVSQKLYYELFIVALKYFVNGHHGLMDSRRLCILKFFELHGIIAEQDMKVETAERLFHHRSHVRMEALKARPDKLEAKRWMRMNKLIQQCHELREENILYQQQLEVIRDEREKEKTAFEYILNNVKK